MEKLLHRLPVWTESHIQITFPWPPDHWGPRSWSSVLWVLGGATGERKASDLFIISQHQLTLKGHRRNSEWHSDSSETTINKGQPSGKSMTEFPLTLSYLYIFKKAAITITGSRSPFGRLIVLQFIPNGSMSVQHPLRCFYDDFCPPHWYQWRIFKRSGGKGWVAKRKMHWLLIHRIMVRV